MSDLDRRGFLGSVLARLAGAAGTVVLASTALPRAAAGEREEEAAPQDPRERADRLAGEGTEGPEYFTLFVNSGFRNNAFRNGGFANGGFRNNAFRNGGFGNGGFRNGAFRNAR